MAPQHLHLDDYPDTLAILSALLGGRPDRAEVGYGATEEGAWVDWDALVASHLSSTEVATIHIARGCAVAERAGGLPPTVHEAVRSAILGITQ